MNDLDAIEERVKAAKLILKGIALVPALDAETLLVEVRQLRKDNERLARMVKATGVCEVCEGTGAGEPDYVEHVAIPTPCEACNGGGSDDFFKGMKYEEGYLRSVLGVPQGKEIGEAVDERIAEKLRAQLADLQSVIAQTQDTAKEHRARAEHEHSKLVELERRCRRKWGRLP